MVKLVVLPTRSQLLLIPAEYLLLDADIVPILAQHWVLSDHLVKAFPGCEKETIALAASLACFTPPAFLRQQLTRIKDEPRWADERGSLSKRMLEELLVGFLEADPREVQARPGVQAAVEQAFEEVNEAIKVIEGRLMPSSSANDHDLN